MPTPSVKSPTVIDRIRRTKVWFARYVGEPVAVVLAGNRDTAEDALEQIVAGSPCTPRLAPSASPKASKGNDGKPDVSRRVGCPKPVRTIRTSSGRPRGAGYGNHPYPLYMQRQRGILKSRTTSGMGRSSALKKKTIGSVVWAIRTWRNLG